MSVIIGSRQGLSKAAPAVKEAVLANAGAPAFWRSVKAFTTLCGPRSGVKTTQMGLKFVFRAIITHLCC